MARDRPDWLVRRELHKIFYYIQTPSSSPHEYLVKLAIKHWLNGKDALELLKEQVPAFRAERACHTARVFLGNERAKRRSQTKEILAQREAGRPTFTYRNTRVTIDNTQHRDYGMAQVSIYALVEVWTKEDEVEKEYLVNFSDYKTKEWLERLMVWGLMNDREILIKPATDAEMSSMRMFVPKDKQL